MKYTPRDRCFYARLVLLPAFIFISFSVMAQTADSSEKLMMQSPVSVVGTETKLQAGLPCDAARGIIVVWVNQDLPKLSTSSITAGQAVNVTGSIVSGFSGTLRFEIYDYATSQKEWTSEPVRINDTGTPSTYQVPLTFPKAGAEKLVFGCFVDAAATEPTYTGVGQRIFPEFANSFSVAGAPGGGGCVAIGGSKFDPTWATLLALALCGLWSRRCNRND